MTTSKWLAWRSPACTLKHTSLAPPASVTDSGPAPAWPQSRDTVRSLITTVWVACQENMQERRRAAKDILFCHFTATAWQGLSQNCSFLFSSCLPDQKNSRKTKKVQTINSLRRNRDVNSNNLPTLITAEVEFQLTHGSRHLVMIVTLADLFKGKFMVNATIHVASSPNIK